MFAAASNSRPTTMPQLLTQIQCKFNPKRIILFGSWARGDARENSDIDLAFELDGHESLSWDEFYSLMLDEAETLHRLDLVRLDTVSGELKNHIDNFGVVVYER